MAGTMRRTVFTLALAVAASGLATLLGCDDVVESELEPTFLATWGDETWEGSARARLRNDTLFIFGVQPAGTWPTSFTGNPRTETNIAFRIGFAGVGTYDLFPDHAWIVYLLGGDGVVGDYRNDLDEDGIVVISRLDEHRVWGAVSFEARSLRDENQVGEFATFIGTFEAEWVPE